MVAPWFPLADAVDSVCLGSLLMALAGYGGKKVLTYQPTAPILSLAFAELANQLPTGVAQQPTVPVCWLLTPYIWF